MSKRERDIKTNARTDVDIVERDNLLRKIRVERRDLNRQLAELSVQRSLIENNVGEEHEHDTDDQDEEEDAEMQGALADTRAEQLGGGACWSVRKGKVAIASDSVLSSR